MNLNYMLINRIIDKLKNTQANKYVAIFGAGKNGVYLNRYLQNSGIKVNFFCDNNSEKQETIIDGVTCISLDQLNKYKSDLIIFVSPNESQEIIKILEDHKFPCIVDAIRRELTDFEKIVYNDGERLIFGVSHDIDEDIRHRSSYIFFKKIIEFDMLTSLQEKMNIVDLGCGVGHGCKTLSELKNSKILGVDISKDGIEYALKHYYKDNIQYNQMDLVKFVENMKPFDYVISRGVLEHITDGLDVALKTKWTKRLIFDVPYKEDSSSNSHHIITNICEKSFEHFPNAEIFYQDLDGIIYNRLNKPSKPNMIICVCSSEDLQNIENFIEFPVSACKLDRNTMNF